MENRDYRNNNIITILFFIENENGEAFQLKENDSTIRQK